MNSAALFQTATFFYFCSMLFFIVFTVRRSRSMGIVGVVVTYTSLLLHTAAILLRWKESYVSGAAIHSTLFDSVILFSWTTVIVFLVLDFKYKLREIGTFVVPFVSVGMIFAQFMLNKADTLAPIYDGHWLWYAQFIPSFTSQTAFALACGTSAAYLLKKSQEEKRNDTSQVPDFFPSNEVLDSIVFQSLIIGLLLLTLSIIFSSLWSDSAWGKYWTWDALEISSALMWLLYASVLGRRYFKQNMDKTTAWLSINNFVAGIVLYFLAKCLFSSHCHMLQ